MSTKRSSFSCPGNGECMRVIAYVFGIYNICQVHASVLSMLIDGIQKGASGRCHKNCGSSKNIIGCKLMYDWLFYADQISQGMGLLSFSKELANGQCKKRWFSSESRYGLLFLAQYILWDLVSKGWVSIESSGGIKKLMPFFSRSLR